MFEKSHSSNLNLIDDGEFKRRYKKKSRLVRKVIIDIFNMRDKNKISWGSIIEKNAEKYSNNIAVKFEDTLLTYKQFNEGVNQYAHYFISIGMKKGDVVELLVPNRTEFLIIVAATAKIGAIASLINIDLREKSLLHCLNLTPARFIIIDEGCLEAFNNIKANFNMTQDQKLFFLPDQGKIPIPNGFVDLMGIVREFPTENPSTTNYVNGSDYFVYIFTSGTTGLPKATVLTHRRVANGIIVFKDLWVGINPEDTIYIPLPFFHATPIGMGWSAACCNGAAIAIGRKFSVSRFWDEIRKYKATAFVYVGEICRYLMNQPSTSNDSNNSVTKIIGNGLRPDIWIDFKERFGIDIVGEFYGASEGGGGFFNFFNFNCTVGYCPTPYAIVKYDVDEDKPFKGPNGFMKKVGLGETGLLLFELGGGAGGFVGYTNKKSTEAKFLHNVFEEGDVWINSGDLLREQGNRHAQFIDRLGDTFRWKGNNVSTTEVEEVLNLFKDILMSTVYGVKIPGTDGRAGMASIIAGTKIREFDFKGLTTYLNKNLAPYAVPIFLRFSEALSLTSTFKLKKSKLKGEGFNIEKSYDLFYILLPGESEYIPLTKDIFNKIQNHKYNF